MIALVITIIVLLILAGISISMLSGDNNILKNAQNAKTETIKATEDEKIKIAISGAYDSNGNFDLGKLEKELDNLELTYSDTGTDLLIELSNGKQVLISKNTGEMRSGVHKIIYNYNGGKDTGEVPIDDTEYKEGENITIKFSPLPTRIGYEFLGWSSNANTTDAEYKASGIATVTMEKRIITLYAVWKAKQYTLNYDANGGTVSQASVTENYGNNITMPTPTRNGYKFTGWYTKVSGGEKVNYTTMPADVETVYARWREYIIGDEVTVKGEQFFVIENATENNNNVKLLSKFNLNIAGTEQENVTLNSYKCLFSSSQYWTGNYTNLNTDSAPEGSAYKKAKVYGAAKGATGRLMTYDEAVSLKSTMSDKLYGRNIGAVDGWLGYWLGSSGGSSTCVWGMNGNASAIHYYDLTIELGIRPIIEIDKNKVV